MQAWADYDMLLALYQIANEATSSTKAIGMNVLAKLESLFFFFRPFVGLTRVEATLPLVWCCASLVPDRPSVLL